MVQGGRRARFLAEALEGGPIDVAGGQGNLERDRAPELRVFGSIDHTHTPARDRLDDPEMGHGASDEMQRIGLWNLFTQDGIDPHQDRVGPRVGCQQLLDGVLSSGSEIPIAPSRACRAASSRPTSSSNATRASAHHRSLVGSITEPRAAIRARAIAPTAAPA